MRQYAGFVSAAGPKPAYCLIVHSRPRYIEGWIPRVYGNVPGAPRAWLAARTGTSAGPYTGLSRSFGRGSAVMALLVSSRGSPGHALEWNVPVLARRILVALGRDDREAGRKARPRVTRQDDLVHVAALGGDVRIGELLPVFASLRVFEGARIGRGVHLATVEDVHRALGPHHRDLGRRPRQVHVTPDVLRRHDVVRASVRLAGDHGQLGHRRLAVGVEQLRAVLDDAAVLLGRPGQESRDVDERHQRDVEAVAEPHEARRLDRRVDVETPGQVGGLVGHDPHRATAQAPEPDNNVGREVRVNLEEVLVVEHAAQDRLHVVGLVRLLGNDRLQRLVTTVHRIERRVQRRILEVVPGDEGE